jgi:uncharacterized protein YacL
MNRVVSHALFIAGLILVGMSVFYVLQIVRLSLWDDVIFRIVSVLAFIGGGIFVGLSRAIKNQDELIQLFRKNKRNDTPKNDS